MEPPTWASFLGVVLATVMLLKAILGRRGRRVYNLPPGPKPWPIIGNLNLMGALPHRSIHELSRKYGPLMQLQFGSFPVVVGSSVDMAKFFLKTHDVVFTDRPKTAAGKYTTYNYRHVLQSSVRHILRACRQYAPYGDQVGRVVGSSVDMAKFFLKTHDVVFTDRPKTAAGKYTTYNNRDITWSPYGAYWRQARKMCLTELFSAKRLESYEYIRAAEVRALLRDLHAASGSGRAVMLKDYLSTVSLNVITRMVLGKKYLDKEEAAAGAGSSVVTTPEEFKWMLDELFLLNGVLNIGDSIPWLDWMDLQGYIKRMKKLSKMFDRFLEHVVEEHNQRRLLEGKSFVAKDMVDVLLQIADDPTLEVELNRESVKAFTQDLIAGGTESSAVTVEWAISELLKKPEVIVMATEELDRVIGRSRWVMEKDMPSLPYVDAIVKETMRLHPVAPMLVPRLSREDMTVAGYDILAGTRVLVSVWSIGRDPALWDAPEEFMPERFLGSRLDVKGQDYELLPFGSGRRMCPGYSLGLKVIQVSLANLLHDFSWSLPDGVTKEELSMEEIFGLSTPRKFPLEAVVEPKLPAHLYAEP